MASSLILSRSSNSIISNVFVKLASFISIALVINLIPVIVKLQRAKLNVFNLVTFSNHIAICSAASFPIVFPSKRNVNMS